MKQVKKSETTVAPKVVLCITLIDGPEPKEIVEDARLRFQGLCKQSLFTMTLRIRTRETNPAHPEPENAVSALSELIHGRVLDEDIYFEGELISYAQSNANGSSGAWVGVSGASIRGLWRKSDRQIVELLPKGNGFLEILE